MVFTKEWIVRSEKTLDITEQVEKTVRKSGIRTGLVQVETCELASGVLRADRNGDKTLLDTVREMRFLIPARINFANTESPEHAAGCVKAALFGSTLTCRVADGALCGAYGIYFLDYDGPRNCVFSVCVVGE